MVFHFSHQPPHNMSWLKVGQIRRIEVEGWSNRRSRSNCEARCQNPIKTLLPSSPHSQSVSKLNPEVNRLLIAIDYLNDITINESQSQKSYFWHFHLDREDLLYDADGGNFLRFSHIATHSATMAAPNPTKSMLGNLTIWVVGKTVQTQSQSQHTNLDVLEKLLVSLSEVTIC